MCFPRDFLRESWRDGFSEGFPKGTARGKSQGKSIPLTFLRKTHTFPTSANKNNILYSIGMSDLVF